MGDQSNAAAFDRMKNKVQHSEATAQAASELAADNVDEKFAALEKQDEVERLLAELKGRMKAQ
jgi:phage shock protein A